MSIFEHTDVDGDRMEVGNAPEEWDSIHSGALAITVTRRREGSQSCALPRAQVERLYDALGFWLFPDVTAAEDPEPIYAALIRRLVAEEVAKMRESVVPLHSSPQAYVPECDATLCTIPGCGLIPDRPTHFEHDPEPHDVGIVDEPAPVEKRCPHGISWNMRCVKCPESDNEPAEAPVKPRLMAELPRRVPSFAQHGYIRLRCAGCGHYKADHGAMHCWGNPGVAECICEGFHAEPSTS